MEHPWAAEWNGPLTAYFGHDTARGLQIFPSAIGIDTGEFDMNSSFSFCHWGCPALQHFHFRVVLDSLTQMIYYIVLSTCWLVFFF